MEGLVTFGLVGGKSAYLDPKMPWSSKTWPLLASRRSPALNSCETSGHSFGLLWFKGNIKSCPFCTAEMGIIHVRLAASQILSDAKCIPHPVCNFGEPQRPVCPSLSSLCFFFLKGGRRWCVAGPSICLLEAAVNSRDTGSSKAPAQEVQSPPQQ